MNSPHDSFLPNGHLYQLQFAIDASKMGSIAVGVTTNNCVVLAAEKQISSPLIVAQNVERILKADVHIGCAMSGAIIDGRRLIHLTRIKTQEHWFDYNESMPIESCIEYTSSLVMPSVDLLTNTTTISRPVGVAFLFGGFDGEVPQLWHLGPSGNYVRFFCKAIGLGREIANKFLEDNYKPQMDIKDAIGLCLLAIQRVMKVPLTATNVEVMYMTKDHKECNKVSELEMMTVLDCMV